MKHWEEVAMILAYVCAIVLVIGMMAIGAGII